MTITTATGHERYDDLYVREDGSVEIPLSNNRAVAIVDAEDVERVCQYAWHVNNREGGLWMS